MWVTRLCRAEWNQGDTEESRAWLFLTVWITSRTWGLREGQLGVEKLLASGISSLPI